MKVTPVVAKVVAAAVTEASTTVAVFAPFPGGRYVSTSLLQPPVSVCPPMA